MKLFVEAWDPSYGAAVESVNMISEVAGAASVSR